ncbi:hypothetical protein PSTT_09117 [Puccinia striiformis]|uniref:MADS-box domain-containing protein n=1 Tax=Puccinia striiformis TaxID=27350 RepID=A0A2S4V9M4_9BASI|nr:hypothetical protein PSTT_09117 [Puccinia striiformis]
MDPVSCLAEPSASRPTRPLPTSAGVPAGEQEPTGSTGSPDLGGTLVSHPPEGAPELSSASEDDDGEGSGSKRRKGKAKYSVPRRQIKIEYIQDKSRRNITFGKRKNGIFKKAQEISTLTGCEVLLIVAPKDQDLNAFTYATPRLTPMIKDPAGETYIQNCLRYGALMPGSSSAISATYGMNGTSGPSPHVSTLRTAPRATPASNASAISYNSSYSYVHNGGMSRRPQPSYAMPHPLSLSPQTSPSTNMTSSKQTPQSVGLSDQAKREASHSPVQPIGMNHQSAKQQQWSPGHNVSTGEFATSPAVTAPNSVMGSSSREIPADWIVNPRSLFQTSSPIGASTMSTRGLSSFPLSTPTTGSGNGYSQLPPDSNPFHGHSSDSPAVATPTWPPVSSSSPGIRTSPLDSAQNIGGSNMSTNEDRFFAPVVLSQPYDSRGLSSNDDHYGPGSGYSNPVSSLHIQSSVSPYGDQENCDGSALSSAYLHEDSRGPDSESKPYQLDNPDSWSTRLH